MIHGYGFGPGRAARRLIASGGTPTPTPTPPPSFDGIAATRGKMLQSHIGGFSKISARSAHVAVGSIDQLKIAVGNWVLGSPSEATYGQGALTLYASVEYPAGTFKRITWTSGATSVTLAELATGISDFTTGALGIPDKATFWINFYCAWVNSTILYNTASNTAMGERSNLSYAADNTMTGITDQGYGSVFNPLAIIGKATTAKSLMILGDSKLVGINDANWMTGTNINPGLVGEVARALGPNLPTSTYPDGIPFFNAASGGLCATANGNNNAWPDAACDGRRPLLPYFTHYHVGLGFNDILTFTRSAASLKTGLQAVFDAINAVNSSAKISAQSIGPKSTTTDNWATLANQTTVNNAERIAHNANVRGATLSASVNNGYFEIADAIESARDSGKWKVNGTANYATVDGIHEGPAGYALAAAAVDPSRFT